MRNLSRISILAVLCTVFLAGCAGQYSPNTYSGNAVQLASKVESGVIIGFREVAISTSGNIGMVTGGAAGGVLGVEYANSALVAVGATAVGGVLGNAIDHAVGDTTGWEYIVRKPNGDMLSVTQREKNPLALAQKVLVIMGPQARVVPDYSVVAEPVVAVAAPMEVKKPDPPVKVEVVLSLPPGVVVQPQEEKNVAVTEVSPAPPAREENLDMAIVEGILAEMGLKSVVATTPMIEAAAAGDPSIATP